MFLLSLMILLLLPGCAGERDKTLFENWQRRAQSAAETSFSARITATWDDGAVTYAADVVRRGEETSVTVTAPETIAGITFRTAGQGTTMEYDGLLLSLTGGREDVLSPCAAPGIFLDALCEGSLLTTGQADEYMTAAIIAPGGETVTVWRTAEDVPVCAEISRDGSTALVLQLADWQIKE